MIGFDDNKYLTTVNTLCFKIQKPKQINTTKTKSKRLIWIYFRQCLQKMPILDDPYYTKKSISFNETYFCSILVKQNFGYDYQFGRRFTRTLENFVQFWKILTARLAIKYNGRKLLAYSEIPDGQSADHELDEHLETYGAGSRLANSEKISEAEFKTPMSDETYKTDLNILHKETKKKEEAKMKKMADK